MVRRSLCEGKIQDTLFRDSSSRDEDSDSPEEWHKYGEVSGAEIRDEEGGACFDRFHPVHCLDALLR